MFSIGRNGHTFYFYYILEAVEHDTIHSKRQCADTAWTLAVVLFSCQANDFMAILQRTLVSKENEVYGSASSSAGILLYLSRDDAVLYGKKLGEQGNISQNINQTWAVQLVRPREGSQRQYASYHVAVIGNR